jgi:hypothetical protein
MRVDSVAPGRYAVPTLLVTSVVLFLLTPIWYFQLDNHILPLRSRNIYGGKIVKSKH